MPALVWPLRFTLLRVAANGPAPNRVERRGETGLHGGQVSRYADRVRWVEITIYQVKKGDRLRLNGGLDFTVQEVLGTRDNFLVVYDSLGERLRIMDFDYLERFQALDAEFNASL